MALEVAIGNPHLEALGQLRQVLATCVNLKKLSVTGIRNRGSSSSLVLCRPGSQMPRLEFLKLRDINVCQPENLRCLRSMAWDTLGHLDSKVATLFTLAPFLKGVRSLVLSHERSDEPINKSYFIRCLETLPKLEHISLKGFTHMVMISVQDLVDRCGTPLRSFRTHGEAATGPNWPYPRLALTKEDVQHIGNRCMRLETFGMDLHVETTWVGAGVRVLGLASVPC